MIFFMRRSCYHEAFFFFIAAGISDFFDGLAARIRNEQSSLGSYLDPFADKFLVLSSLFLLQSNNHIPNMVPMWFSTLMFARELLLVLASVFLYSIYGKTAIIAPTVTSKISTMLSLALLSLIFGSYLSGRHYPNLLSPFFIANAVFALISTAQYAVISTRKVSN